MVSNDDESVKTKHETDRTESAGYEAFRIYLKQAAAERIGRGKPSQSYFDSFSNWVGLATFLIVLAYTVINLVLWLAQREANEINESNLIETNRAWVSAPFVFLGAPLEWGGPIAFQLRLANVGHGPATQVEYKFEERLVPPIQQNSDTDSMQSVENRTCAGLEAKPGGGPVIFPGETKFWVPYRFPDTPQSRAIAEAAKSHRGSVVLDGCVAYRSYGAHRYTAFRFFLRDVPGPSCVPAKEGLVTPQGVFACWNFNNMLSGNDAD